MRKGHTAGVNECMWHIACVCGGTFWCVCERRGQGPTNRMRGLLICIINC